MLKTIHRKKPQTLSGAFALFGLALFSSPMASASDWALYSEFDSLTYSESFSIYDAVNDGFEGRGFAQNGNNLLTHNQFEIGARKGAWDLALLTRYDFLVEYSSDTAALLLASELEQAVPNEAFDIFIGLNQSQSHGVRLGYHYDVTPDLTFTGRVSGLLAYGTADGEIGGSLAFTDDEIETGDLALDYVFTRDIIFGREFDRPNGYGASFDAIIDWQASEKLSVKAAAYDLFGRIWWKDLPRTVADATTSISRLQNNGILLVRPTINGQNFFENYTQTIAPRYTAAFEYKLSPSWSLSQDILSFGRNQLTETEVSYHFSDDKKIGASFEWVSNAVGINLHWKALKLEFATDSFSHRKARYAKVNIGLVKRF